MTNLYEKLDEIVERSWVDVYTANPIAMMDYPYILNHVNESSPSLCMNSKNFILDSTIDDDSVGSKEVYEKGREIGADWIVPSDVENNPQRTTEEILRLLSIVDSGGYSPEVIIPLQSSRSIRHVEHYRRLEEKLSEHGYLIEDYPLAIGGVRKKSIKEQIMSCKEVRDVVGYDTHIHLFGAGFTKEWIITIRENPELIDSMDSSSIAQNVLAGTIFDRGFNRVDFLLPRGDNSTPLRTLQMMHQLYLFNYLIGPDVREKDIPSNSHRPEISQSVSWD